MAEKVRLTKAIIDKLTPPSSGRLFVYDAGGPAGLCLCLMAGGSRTWFLYRKVNRRPVRLKLGRWPDITIDKARQLATEAAGRTAAGEDIQAQRAAARKGELTWGDLFAKYLEEHAKVHKKTWKEDLGNDRRYLQDWKHKSICAITKPIVAQIHRDIGKTAKTTANRVLSLISKVFNFADEAGIWEGRNPTKGVKKFREQSRDRFVQTDEMPKLLAAIRSYPDKTLGHFFELCLLTGARRANVLAMAWQDIDLTAGVWRIPETKSGKPVVVVLTDRAKEILEGRKTSENTGARLEQSPWVFPSFGRSGHLVEPKKAWAAILEDAGLTNLKIHDLRRTLASWQAIAGTSLPIIGKSLGHSTPAATAIYARLQLDPVRESVGNAVSAMMKTMKKKKKKNPKKKRSETQDSPQHPGGKKEPKPNQKRASKRS